MLNYFIYYSYFVYELKYSLSQACLNASGSKEMFGKSSGDTPDFFFIINKEIKCSNKTEVFCKISSYIIKVV